jgi:hypothetical protein
MSTIIFSRQYQDFEDGRIDRMGRGGGWCLIEFVILAHQNRPLTDSRKSPFLRGI